MCIQETSNEGIDRSSRLKCRCQPRYPGTASVSNVGVLPPLIQVVPRVYDQKSSVFGVLLTKRHDGHWVDVDPTYSDERTSRRDGYLSLS